MGASGGGGRVRKGLSVCVCVCVYDIFAKGLARVSLSVKCVRDQGQHFLPLQSAAQDEFDLSFLL